MERNSLTDFIQSVLPMSRNVAADIASRFGKREIPCNNFFLKEGNFSTEYMFLEKGSMRAYAIDTEGNEVTTCFYTPNAVVFEVSAFFTHTRSKESIVALTDCVGYTLTFDQLNTLFHAIPEFREFGRAILVNGFVTLKQRTLSLINETAEERYKNLMDTNPEIFQFAKLKYIASYLGITDTSLSRIRKEYMKG